MASVEEFAAGVDEDIRRAVEADALDKRVNQAVSGIIQTLEGRGLLSLPSSDEEREKVIDLMNDCVEEAFTEEAA